MSTRKVRRSALTNKGEQTQTSAMMEHDLHIAVVSHSHWDREWYKTAEAFRVHLVALIDDFLEGRGTSPYLLDGQTIVLNDYLAVRPERREYLSRMLQDATIEAGPWFVLGDNLIAGGEAIVRNLLIGRADMRLLAVGPEVSPAVMYCPDSFGHPAALPLIAQGFGFATAVLWRGYGGRGWPEGDAFRWTHAGGGQVLVHHLPPEGYGDAANLPSDAPEASKRWTSLLDLLSQRASARPGGIVLALNGADHHAQQRDLTTAMSAAATAVAPMRIARTTLRNFAATFASELAEAQLPVVSGELRASPSYVWALQGTFSSRAAQKRRNARIEWTLLRDVEPWVAMARWHGKELGHHLETLWREALTNHPHDTLCGCSIDAVASQFDARCERVEHASRELRDLALSALSGVGAISNAVRAQSESLQLQVRNPSMRAFSGVIECAVDFAVARVPVGPGSAGSAPNATDPRQVFSVGKPRASQQILSREGTFRRIESPTQYPVNQLVDRYTTLVWINDLPALGARFVAINRGSPSRRRGAPTVTVAEGRLQSDLLTVWCDDVQGLCMEDCEGRRQMNVLAFESVGEQGDLYTHSAIPGSHREGKLLRHRIVTRGPLRASMSMQWRVPIAARSLQGAAGELVEWKDQAVLLNTVVELDAGSDVVRLRISGNNAIADYRLRVLLRSGIVADSHVADAAFGFVQRSSSPPEFLPDDVEVILPTHPLHRTVTITGADRGMTVCSDGLAEYEATPQGDVAITLLRATGELSRNNLRERPGHAGWPARVPNAQSFGPFNATLGVFLHGPRTNELFDAIAARADVFVAPPRGETVVGCPTCDDVPGIELIGEGLQLIALKPAEHGSGIVARVQNVTPETRRGVLHIPGVGAVWLARLDERQLAALPVENERVEFFAEPHAVLTFVLSR